MDPYATHLEVLIGTAADTKGPILELGCGNYSTLPLAALCAAQGRQFKAQASNAEWAAQFGELVEIVDWATWEPPVPEGGGKWGMVFLDSEEAVRDRIKRLPILADITDRVVMHDANVAYGNPEFRSLIEKYKQVLMFRRYVPWTACLHV